MEKLEVSNPSKPRVAPLVDGVTKWSAAAGAMPAAIEEIRLDASDKSLIPFTSSLADVNLHYLGFPSMSGYVRCNGTGCLLCRIGQKVDTRELWPVYDPFARAVGVVAISPNMRPSALKPQLFPVLPRAKAGDRIVVVVRKVDRVRYAVSVLDLPPDADDGAAQIAAFQDRVERGDIDLAGIYLQLAEPQLAEIPEVATDMKIRGISL